MKNFAASFIELFQKKDVYDKRAGIHNNGIDNNYPELVESRICNSVTALRCKNLMASYVSGKGFGDEANKIIVNEKKEISLLQLTQEIADSISEHNGVFIHLNYNMLFQVTSMEVLPFTDCRIGKKDGDDYSAKILVCKDWSDGKLAKKARPVDVYNPKESVIAEQIKAAGSVSKYNGQILYFKFGKYTYPLSPIHPCLMDADSEHLASTFKNTSLKKGFFGKTLVVTKPLIDTNLDKDDEEYRIQSDAREEFKKTIQQFIGVENNDGVMHMEMEFASDEIDKEILFKNIDSNINDKLFAHTENSVQDNIRMCFNNVPAPLIRSQEGALFGSSGEAIQAMKVFYQDQTTDERMIVEQIIAKLMKKFTKPVDNLKIIPLIAIPQPNADQ